MWAFSVLVGSSLFPGSFSKQLWEKETVLTFQRQNKSLESKDGFFKEAGGRSPYEHHLCLGAVALPSTEPTHYR